MCPVDDNGSLEALKSSLRLAESLQRLAVNILGFLNDDRPFSETLDQVVTAIQDSTGAEAIGIRLRNGNEFGYFASRGFSQSFLDAENALAVRSPAGDICRDEGGKPRLECTCGLILSGRSRQQSQAFTSLGSCFVNHGKTSLVFAEPNQDPRINPRGRCFSEGYESMALVPVRAHQEIVGLLQLCDKRPGRFTTEMVEFFEGLSASIGLALTRKQAKEELKSKSSRLNLALTLVGMGAWSWEIGENRRLFDDHTCRLLGIAKEEFRGTADEFFSAVHPDDRSNVARDLQRTLAGSGMYETEYRAVWKDGSIHHIAARGSCIRDSQGQPIRIEGIVWDITDRRLAEAALRHNETVQRTIIANISDVIAIVDAAGITRFKSSNLEKWFGWQPEEVVGKPASENVHPDDQPAVNAQFGSLLSQPGAAISVECRYRCKDGSYKWIEVNAINLLNDPDIGGILLNYQDISKRKRAQAALQESEERHRVLFQNSRDALMTLAPPDWRFSDCNAAAVALFAVRDETDFKSHAPWQLSPEHQPDGRASKEKARAMIDAAMQNGAQSFEWIHRKASGEDFPAIVDLAPVELYGIQMIQATVRDDSERKRMLARMAQSDRHTSLGMLAAGVAHEINNPLAYVRYNIESLAEDLPRLTSAIRRACDTVRKELGDEEHRRLLDKDTHLLEDAPLDDIVERGKEALEGIQRIVSITRALSTFSRVEQANCTKVDVANAIDAAINMAHNEVTHRARLSKVIEPLPSVWASEGKLSHAFLNLVINAAQAIDEGNVANNAISIHAWSVAQAVVVEIADTGSGIVPENLERIFEPFYTTKPLGHGAGLGLSIAKNILAEFGGSLSVSSQVGIGSRFTVRLPVMKQVSVSISKETPPPECDALGMNGRILLIEDESNIVRSLTRLLGKSYTLVAVSSGKEGQDLITADPNFDLILCDLMMSRMSGIEFHAWLATYNPKLASQLIFITGGAFTPKAREYLEKVSNLTLEKPFEAAELRRQIAESVQSARRNAGEVGPNGPRGAGAGI